MSNLVSFSGSNPSGSVVTTLTGDSGGAVSPTAGNINVVGAPGVTVVGTPGDSTLTINVDGSVPTTFDADSGSASPALNIINISGGPGITTSATGNTVTITSSMVASWSEVTSGAASMAINSGYIANFATLVTLTLPATAALGSFIRIAGKGVGLWKIAQNLGQVIHFGSSDTTTGVAGSLAATLQYDAIELLCITANTNWVVLSVQGNITVV